MCFLYEFGLDIILEVERMKRKSFKDGCGRMKGVYVCVCVECVLGILSNFILYG